MGSVSWWFGVWGERAVRGFGDGNSEGFEIGKNLFFESVWGKISFTFSPKNGLIPGFLVPPGLVSSELGKIRIFLF